MAGAREPGRAAAQQDLVFEVLEELDRVASLHRPVSAAVLAACLGAPHIAEAAAELRAAEGTHADEDGHFDSAVRFLEPAVFAWKPCHRRSASLMLCCQHKACGPEDSCNQCSS